VSPGYLGALRTPLLNGRDLASGDTDAAEPVPTVVNRAFGAAVLRRLPKASLRQPTIRCGLHRPVETLPETFSLPKYRAQKHDSRPLERFGGIGVALARSRPFSSGVRSAPR